MTYDSSVSRKMKEPTTPLGKWVRRVRLEAGKLQDEFGPLVGVHPKTVTRWESGRQPVEMPNIQVILRRFPDAIRRVGPPPVFPWVDGDPGVDMLKNVQTPQPTYSLLSMMRAIEAWAIQAGGRQLVEDQRFLDGLEALWNEHRKRVAPTQPSVQK